MGVDYAMGTCTVHMRQKHELLATPLSSLGGVALSPQVNKSCAPPTSHTCFAHHNSSSIFNKYLMIISVIQTKFQTHDEPDDKNRIKERITESKLGASIVFRIEGSEAKG